MKRDDLHPDLQIEYDDNRGYGVEKLPDPAYQHMWFVVPKPLPRSMKEIFSGVSTQELHRVLGRSNRVLNSLKPLSEMTKLDSLIARLIIRQEAVASSRMEGTNATIDEVFSAGAGDSNPSGDVRSVVGYAKAMEQLIASIHENQYETLDTALFKNLHRAIVEGDDSFVGIPGEFRHPGGIREVVFIGGLGRKENSTYNPAPSKHVARLMADFIAWLKDEELQNVILGEGLPLPVRMAVGHAYFETIHPFPDGNGRVGRMIWPIQMMLEGKAPLHLSRFIDAHKDGYYEGLKAWQQKLKIMPFLEYLGEAMEESLRETTETRKAIEMLPERWQGKLSVKKGSAASRILPHLMEHPIMSAEDVIRLLNVSLPAATGALKQLAQAGILKEKSGRQRKQKYAAEDVLSILSRPFGSDPNDILSLLDRESTVPKRAIASVKDQGSVDVIFCQGLDGRGCRQVPPVRLRGASRRKRGVCSLCDPAK
ncbi:Fic family protein [Oligoflexus tunisiensis]|uniref:Fic family protein n=1 Tax=Oligoflexus tunisiensis TaxID=708132 RepID=UPI00114CC127|nr:Fic/DOC family N-terminal domain-containing protein [Oligoflexus tunisiensis]